MDIVEFWFWLFDIFAGFKVFGLLIWCLGLNQFDLYRSFKKISSDTTVVLKESMYVYFEGFLWFKHKKQQGNKGQIKMEKMMIFY